MFGHRGAEFLAQGNSRFFHPGNATFRAHRDRNVVRFEVDAGSFENSLFFDFAAPGSQSRLTEGEYKGATRSEGMHRPGISITVGSRGCRETAGRFVVKDIAFAGEHEVTRLWLLYQQTCDGNPAPIIGEIRYRMPGHGGKLAVGPRSLRWPDLPIGGIAAAIPVRAVNTSRSTIKVAGARLEGPPGMTIRLDDCSGRTLVSNESCAVWVRFSPSREGRQTGRLHIVETGGVRHTTRLYATIRGRAEATPVPGKPGAELGGGETIFQYDSDPGDYVGQGESETFDLSNADFRVEGNNHYVLGDIVAEDGETWSVHFQPPGGDVLAPGLIYEEAQRAPFAQGPAGLDISGDSRGCNMLEGSFEVHAIRVDTFGNLLSFSASFVQHCEGMEPALRGIFRYRLPEPHPTPSPYPRPRGR